MKVGVLRALFFMVLFGGGFGTSVVKRTVSVVVGLLSGRVVHASPHEI